VPARDNALQGDFGEAWLEAVAAGCGLLHGRPSTVDLEKADVELTRKYSEIVWLLMGRTASTSTNADALTGLPNTYADASRDRRRYV
jgi:hypothetical protein